MTSDLQSQLEELRIEAEKAISSADSLESLDELRVNYLGKKGQLGVLLRGMGKLSAEERPKIGAIANVVKEALQNNLDKQRAALETAKIQAQIEAETIDVTMPGVFRPQGRIHPLNGVIDRTLDIFVGMGYTVAAGPEMESDYYNFEALNTPPDHPARDMQDTFYLPDGNLWHLNCVWCESCNIVLFYSQISSDRLFYVKLQEKEDVSHEMCQVWQMRVYPQ